MDPRSTPLLGLALVGCAAHHQPSDGHLHHHFDDADRWAQHFEDPARDAWQKPDEVLAALELAPDALVADIGAGTGYFPVRVAKRVPRGRVYGVDLSPSMVAYLAQRAQREGLANLTAIQATEDDARLPEAVDLVMLVDTYHHLDDRPAYFRRLAGQVRPGGRLVVIDFKLSSSMGPPASAKVPPEAVAAELAEAGWVLKASPELLPEQYLLVFARR
jgi:cyclopropane fatty-acyl-phospholipid synthase-like methyltransferase